MMRSLVIYYSKSGNTELVAKTIKQELGAHVREVTDYTINRSTTEYIFTSLLDSASISPKKIDIDYYETIFIGTPVWLGSITPAIKKIIDNIDFKNKNIVLFNTMREVGGSIAMRRMAKLVRKNNGNVIHGFTITTKCSKEDICELTRTALKDIVLTWNNYLE